MYVDSTYADKPAGDLPVAEELRKHVEPLLMVSQTHNCGHPLYYEHN